MIYYISILLALISSLTNSRILFKVACTFSALLFSFTYGYGYDWINYRDIYEGLNYRVAEGLPFEPGYYYIMRFFSYLHLPFQLLHVVTTLFIHFCAYKFCKNARCPNVAYFTVLSFMGFFLYIEQIRQCIAISIIMLFYNGASERRGYRNLLGALFASLFHVSAIISVFIIYFDNKSKQRAFILKYVVVSSLGLFFTLFLFSNPEYLSVIPFLKDKVSLYSLVSNSLSNSLFIPSSLVYVFLIIFIYRCDLISKKYYASGLFTQRALMSSVFIWQTKAAFFLQRLQYYAVPSLVFGMDNFLASRKKNSIYRYVYLSIIFLISLIPLRFEIYRDSINNPLLVTDSVLQVREKIMQRCSDLKSADPENFIIKQCN